MSLQFTIYAAIATAAWLIALWAVKPRRALDLSRCAGWYLLLFLLTYVIRPAGSEVIGDDFLYRWLKIGSFEKHWQLMTVAVPMAILSFALGYTIAGNAAACRTRRKLPSRQGGFVEGRQARTFAYFLVVLGYVATIATIKSGMAEGVQGDYAGSAVGVYEHNSAVIAQSHLMVSTGAVLYYIITGRLYMSLILAGPWLILRLIYGWGRIFIIGHLFALTAVYFLSANEKKESVLKTGQTITLMTGIAVVVLVVFPILSAMRGLKSTLGVGGTDFSLDIFTVVAKTQLSVGDLASKFFSTDSDIAGFEQTLYHLITDKRSELGTQYLYYYFLEPIPRTIWSGKGTPYSWPERLRGIEVDPRAAVLGMAPGAIGMAFQEWGWMGIVFEFLFTGWLMRRAEEAAKRRTEAAYIQLAYAGFYSMLPQLGRDSLLYMISQRWIFIYGPAVLVLWVIYRNNSAALRARYRRHVPGGIVQTVIPGVQS